MTLYLALVDNDLNVDSFLITAFSGNHVVKSFTVSVDKENPNEKLVCVL